MTLSPAGAAFRDARDFLLARGSDPVAAHAEFRWPDVGEHFNFAVDWFDGIAEGNDRVALRVVEEDGTEATRTFEQLRVRSNQVANWLTAAGVRRGDAVMLMLDNRVELWEAMLAILKLGAVILPTSTAFGEDPVNQLMMAKVTSGQPLRYYVGGAWSRAGEITSRAQWESYVADAALRAQHPVKVALKAQP